MKQSNFLEIERAYYKERTRLNEIKRGDLVWEAIARGGFEMDYHPAVVKDVNVDEDYVSVIDVSPDNKERLCTDFLTESEMIKSGFSAEIIEQEHRKYAGIIKMVLESK